MTTHSAKDLPVNKVVALVKKGEVVTCPDCGSQLQTMPKDWVEGTPLGMIKCPVSEDHYALFIENAEAMHKIRDLIRGFGDK